LAVTCPKCHLSNPDTSHFCADCGTPLLSSTNIHPGVTETLQTPINELTTGSTFAGRYQIIEELGHGLL
jgi:serine/threonine-protein kinase